MLSIGDKVPLELGGSAVVTDILGSGGQGTVYRAEYAAREYALKIYFPKKLKSPEIFRENLRRLTEDKLKSAGSEMGLQIHVMHEDIFNSMHKI